MNTTEVRFLFNLLHQNERLVAIVHRLLEERDHDRYSRVADPVGVRIPVEYGSRFNFSATHASIPPADGGPDRVLPRDLGLGPDRGEPRPDDPAGADADRDVGLPDAGTGRLVAGGIHFAYIPARGDRGLHGEPGPGDGAEPECGGGDSLPPGGDGAGDDPGRVGDRDAGADDRERPCANRTCEFWVPDTSMDCCEGMSLTGDPAIVDCERYRPVLPSPPPVVVPHADCRYRDGYCGAYENWVALGAAGDPVSPCVPCADYEPLEPPPAPPPVVAPAGKTKHCPRCDRDRPLSAFLPRKHICNECLPPAERAPAPADPHRRASTSLAQDPGYQRGLSAQLDKRAIGYGACEVCGKAGCQLYEHPDPDDERHVCYACLQAAERERGHCLICGQPIVGRRANATTCGGDCARERHRRQCAADYAKKKEARVTVLTGGV